MVGYRFPHAIMGKEKWKKKNTLMRLSNSRPSKSFSNTEPSCRQFGRQAHAWMRDPSKTPLSPPLSRYVLATCPCTSSLAFSFPFPPKREDPEKRHTGNPVRHNCPKTLLMSRGRKLTNADPNLYIRSGISNFPCIFFMSYQGTSPEAGLVSPLFSQTWQMVGISFGEKKGVGGGMCFGRKEGTRGRMYV